VPPFGPAADPTGPGRGDWFLDRQADLEIEDFGVHLQMMREPGAGDGNSLGGNRRLHLLEARPHDFLDLGARNGRAEHSMRRIDFQVLSKSSKFSRVTGFTRIVPTTS
jgi:hypothetical protein